MIERINRTDMAPTTLGYRIHGTVDAVHFDTFQRELAQTIDNNGNANVLFEVGDMASMEASHLVGRVRNAIPNLKKIERIAWVTDRPGLKMAGAAVEMLPGVNVKTFGTGEQAIAWRWAATGTQTQTPVA